MSNETVRYCNLDDFAKSYREIHGYLSVLVCIFGSVANILNICILTTREMRWPTNFILTGIAVADLFVMLVYIPFASHQYLNSKPTHHSDNYSYSWVVYLKFYASFSLIFHFISCCLTVILAVWRYIAINHPQNNKLWYAVNNVKSTLYAILFIYVICPVICIPVYLAQNIKSNRRYVDNNSIILNKKYLGGDYNITVYTIDISGDFVYATFWVYTVVIKLVPCVLLTILSMRLISALMDTKKRRRELINNSGVPLKDQSVLKQRRHIEKELQTDRTTRMLVAVLLLFLITELPQAILGLFCILMGKDFLNQCYIPLGDVIDMLALVNSAINFILYCSMSRQFRSAFGELFRPKLLNKWLPLPTHIEMNGAMTQVTQV
ncbi:G-protein coupled receptor dmsr-1-like [Onthophagus taurus]|uniref:G-protein coupled receptor dmsr-1-like n=1 Tax=Onthophagus taurus TaxID=166361 RepID=UPI000C205972|nr:sex peptide receptor-like [Onthophagus taurus]